MHANGKGQTGEKGPGTEAAGGKGLAERVHAGSSLADPVTPAQRLQFLAETSETAQHSARPVEEGVWEGTMTPARRLELITGGTDGHGRGDAARTSNGGMEKRPGGAQGAGVPARNDLLPATPAEKLARLRNEGAPGAGRAAVGGSAVGAPLTPAQKLQMLLGKEADVGLGGVGQEVGQGLAGGAKGRIGLLLSPLPAARVENGVRGEDGGGDEGLVSSARKGSPRFTFL